MYLSGMRMGASTSRIRFLQNKIFLCRRHHQTTPSYLQIFADENVYEIFFLPRNFTIFQLQHIKKSIRADGWVSNHLLINISGAITTNKGVKYFN